MDRFYIDDDYCGLVYDKETNTYFGNETSCELLNKNDKEISELEAKLAEAQKIIEIQKMSNDALIDENLDYRYDITDTAYEEAKYMAKSWEEDYQQEIKELKQQLGEKEEEIEKLKTTNDRLYKKNKKLENQIVESNIRFYKKGALEQLEKVRKYIKTSDKIFTEYYGVMERNILIKQINNQIEELKKEMK